MRPVGEGAQGTREASRVVVRIQVLKRHKMLILAFAHLRPMSWCNDIIGAWLNCRSRVPRFRDLAQAKLVSKRWIIFHKTWGRQLSRVSAHWINRRSKKIPATVRFSKLLRKDEFRQARGFNRGRSISFRFPVRLWASD